MSEIVTVIELAAAIRRHPLTVRRYLKEQGYVIERRRAPSGVLIGGVSRDDAARFLLDRRAVAVDPSRCPTIETVMARRASQDREREAA